MKSLSIQPKLFYTTLLGNLLEHFDKALFGLLAPFLAPLFFPHTDPIVSLILIYLPLGFLSRPLGAFIFGKIGDQYGKRRALYISLMGMSFTCAFTALIPTYSSIGLMSACLLYLSRALVDFFAAGEGPGAAILLIEKSPKSKQSMMSSYYEMSSILGTFFATLLIAYLSFHQCVLAYWRPLFLIASLLGLSIFWIRRNILAESSSETQSNKTPFSFFKLSILAVVLVTGLSCSNLKIVSQMLNGYLPLVSSIKAHDMLMMHASLLLFDFILLPLMGKIAQKISAQKLIFCALTALCSLSWPLFHLLTHPTLTRVLLLRFILIVLGIAIAAPFNAWAIEILGEDHRFKKLALSRAMGSTCIGGFSISISLWIYNQTQWVESPALYIICTSFSAIIALIALNFKKITRNTKNTF